ncbi:hypothetical protein J2T49_004614 [Pseudomonas nitroreducens]|nr:hypothetical protein [Pseudomonas nitroreducens]MCP1688645.1 hypothetical protein [Pseudomonas nitroreducens]
MHRLPLLQSLLLQHLLACYALGACGGGDRRLQVE